MTVDSMKTRTPIYAFPPSFQVQHSEDVFCALRFAVSVTAPGKFFLPVSFSRLVIYWVDRHACCSAAHRSSAAPLCTKHPPITLLPLTLLLCCLNGFIARNKSKSKGNCF